MKDGSTVTVRSWEDAGGDFVYTKGANNDNLIHRQTNNLQTRTVL